MYKSKKYAGVYLYNRKDGDITYYVSHRVDKHSTKQKMEKVGKRSDGYTEYHCFLIRRKLGFRNIQKSQSKRNFIQW